MGGSIGSWFNINQIEIYISVNCRRFVSIEKFLCRLSSSDSITLIYLVDKTQQQQHAGDLIRQRRQVGRPSGLVCQSSCTHYGVARGRFGVTPQGRYFTCQDYFGCWLWQRLFGPTFSTNDNEEPMSHLSHQYSTQLFQFC